MVRDRSWKKIDLEDVWFALSWPIAIVADMNSLKNHKYDEAGWRNNWSNSNNSHMIDKSHSNFTLIWNWQVYIN